LITPPNAHRQYEYRFYLYLLHNIWQTNMKVIQQKLQKVKEVTTDITGPTQSNK